MPTSRASERVLQRCRPGLARLLDHPPDSGQRNRRLGPAARLVLEAVQPFSVKALRPLGHTRCAGRRDQCDAELLGAGLARSAHSHHLHLRQDPHEKTGARAERTDGCRELISSRRPLTVDPVHRPRRRDGSPSIGQRIVPRRSQDPRHGNEASGRVQPGGGVGVGDDGDRGRVGDLHPAAPALACFVTIPLCRVRFSECLAMGAASGLAR